MNLRPKTKRRLIVLLSSALVCVALGGTFVIIQLHRHARIRQGYRDTAMAAFSRGDYVAAMFGFKKYLSQNSADGPAIYAYAVARSEVPEPDLKHLVKAKAILARYLELNPDDIAAHHKLLEIYRKIRYDSEALSLANTLLAQDPNDVVALQAKLQAMIDQSAYSVALPISLKVNELAPLDLQSQLTTYRLMSQLRQPTAGMVARAEKMLAKHPGDPRFELLRAIAADLDGDEKSVRKWLALAASRPVPDVQFIEELSGLFERMGMFEQARALLADSLAGNNNDPDVMAVLIERQWEAGESGAALNRLTNLDAVDLRTDAHLLGLKALILYSRGGAQDRADADDILQGLARRDGENVASAWTALLHAQFSVPAVDARQEVALCQAALHRDPENAIARYFLGIAYSDLGETELALQSWRWAAKLATPWAAPHLREARALLDTGRVDQAYQEAVAAQGCSGTPIEPARMIAVTGYARLSGIPSPAEISSLLDFVRGIRKQRSDDAVTLPVYVGLLARNGQTAEALATANKALTASLPPNVLLQLARASAAQHLGIEPAIADLLAEIKPTTPEIVFDRALILTMLGESAEGLQSLTAARNAAGDSSTPWQLALARYRQLINDGELAPLWAALGDGNAKDLQIQRAVLESASAWSDHKLIDRTIDRIKSLTGDECISWRLARAQLDLINSGDPKVNAGAAAAMMADVVRMAPDLVDAQFLWAKSLEKLGDADAAIDRLHIAALLAPRDLEINLHLAEQLHLRGRDDDARVVLEALSQNPSIAPAVQVQIAHNLYEQGQIDSAIRVLTSPAARADEPDCDILLALVYQHQGKIDQAADIYSSLIQSRTASDTAIQAAAWFIAWRGDVPGGLRLLDRQSDGRELALARFDEVFAGPEVAVVHYQAAATAAPSDLSGWKALAGFQLRRNKFDDAIATVDAALKLSPDDRELKALRLRAKSFSAIPVSPAIQSLIVVLSTQPNDEPGIQTLDAIVQPLADQEPPDQFLPKLRVVADNYPRFVAVQMLLVEQCLAAGHVKEAEDIAERSMRASPIEAEPAKEMTILCSGAQRWDKALSAALQWRERTLDRPFAADVEIADARVHLNDAAGAIKQIMPYLDQVKLSPNQNIDVVRVYTRALVQSGKIRDSQALLEPLLSQSPRWRLMWLDLGVNTATDAVIADNWISKIAPQMIANGENERLALARGYFNAGRRFAHNAEFTKAQEIIHDLAEVPNPRADALILLGSIAMENNDTTTAESDFRRAMKTDPNNPAAPSDLAALILQRSGDLNEARQMAGLAITLAPDNGASRYTLACIDAKAGNFQAAIDGFASAIEINGADIASMIGLAEVHFRSGHRDQAAAALDQADPLLKQQMPASAMLQKKAEMMRLALRAPSLSTSVTDVK